MEYLISITLVGIGATIIMDIWGLLRKPLFGIPAPNYALVGRWIGHMTRGRFRHNAIVKSTSVAGERLLGWSAHYLIGVAFAAI